MMPGHALFEDRQDAGRQLAEALLALGLADPVVLALPRGGVPVAFLVARALRAPLDLMLVRKIGAPGHPEFGIGAVVDGNDPQLVLNEEDAAVLAPWREHIEAEKRRQLLEIERWRRLYLKGRPPVSVEDRTAVLVDDGIATGGTAKAALKGLRKAGAKKIVLAVPVAPPDTLAEIEPLTDEIVCLATPTPFVAVSLHYARFEQTSDDEVIQLLAQAQWPAPDQSHLPRPLFD